MEKELWDNAQLLVGAGLGHLVKHLYIEELEQELTPEQLEKLGDLPSLIGRMLESKPSNVKDLIDRIVYLSREGAILGPKNSR